MRFGEPLGPAESSWDSSESIVFSYSLNRGTIIENRQKNNDFGDPGNTKIEKTKKQKKDLEKNTQKMRPPTSPLGRAPGEVYPHGGSRSPNVCLGAVPRLYIYLYIYMYILYKLPIYRLKRLVCDFPYSFHLFFERAESVLARSLRPGGQVVFRRLPGGGMIHFNRIWTHGGPWWALPYSN